MAQVLAEKEQARPVSKESVASARQSEQLARTPELLLPKGDTNRAITPDHEMGESQGKRELHLCEKEGDLSLSVEKKRSVLH